MPGPSERPACSDCGAPTDLRPLRLLTDATAKWLCEDADACVGRTLQRFYWTNRRATLLLDESAGGDPR